MTKSNFQNYAPKALIGSQIRKRRLQCKMTLTALAQEVGISKTYLSLIESNEKVPDTNILFKLCEVLDLLPHELLLRAYLENKTGETERCWTDTYPDIKKAINGIQQNLYSSTTKPITS